VFLKIIDASVDSRQRSLEIEALRCPVRMAGANFNEEGSTTLSPNNLKIKVVEARKLTL
jgi:hypothetical protein